MDDMFGVGFAAAQPDAPIDVTDPWRGLYRPEHLRANGDGGVCHPDLPSWPDDREDALDKLIHAQGFDFKIIAGDFSDEGIEDGDERYWQEIRAWTPEAPDGDWRLAWKGDTEDGPYAWFVRPMALRPEPEAVAARQPVESEPFAWVYQDESGFDLVWVDRIERTLPVWKYRNAIPLYTAAPAAVIPMVLHCPRCHLQHIDAPDERTPEWHNPPHRSHLCHGCGFVWRPADVPTVGVERTQTTGKNDSPPEPAAVPVDEVNLDALAWKSLMDAARQTEWMPREYMVNDWLADLREYLIKGPAAKEQGDA